MRKIISILLLVLLCSLSLWANETPVSSIDSVAVDTIANPDPEWYVAPLTRDSLRAGKRALVAATSCSIDSVQIFNVDSVLTDVLVYEYGDTTRTTTWTINPDGSRAGLSKEESGTKGDITFTASYNWDATANDWKGLSKEEHTFAGSRETLRSLYDWQNGAWSAHTQYTWLYDASGRETEYTTYARNNTTLQLVPSKQRLREYNAAGKMTQEINYTAHDGNAWSAGTKRIYDYDAAGNQIECTYYSSYNNGAWVASTHEISSYTDGYRTYYKQETWNATEWVFSSELINTYDEDGNIVLAEKYGVKNGVRTGTMKEEYIFDENQEQVCVFSYRWSNGEWVNYSKMLTNYHRGDTIESCQYYWNNETWEGRGTRTFSIYNENGYKTEQVSQKWGKNSAKWENETRVTYFYTDTKKTQEASYKWENDAWVGVARSDWHYTAGKNDTLWVYAFVGAEWVDSLRTVYSYSGNSVALTHNAAWDRENAKWVLASMTRTDILKNEAGRQTLSASWSCGADSVWIGVKKDTMAYLGNTSKKTYEAHYTSWADNDWVASYKIEYQYNEKNVQILKDRYNWKNGAWVGGTRLVNGYDENGRDTLNATYNKWDAVTQDWIGYQKTTKTYSANGTIASMMVYKWGSSTWMPSSRYTYSYDESNREIEQVAENYKNDVWTNATKYEREYKGATQVKNNTYQWLNNKWMFTSRNETYYDDDVQAKLRREIMGSWNSNTGALISFADNHYFYACDPKLAFTIRFENEDGTLLDSKEVQAGTVPTYDGETPSKGGNEQYSYTFKGWDRTIVPATADATYTATYNTTVNTYLVIFMNGETVLQSTEVAYGVTPVYTGEMPSRPATAEYIYTFTGWDKAIAEATADATYTATFSATKRQYTITWLNEDGSQIDQTTVEYGLTPAHAGINKESTAEYTYTFAGWDKELVAVEGDATYTATFTATKRQYTITWLNEDNSQLAQAMVEYGVIPTAPEAPSKGATAEYTYTFAGWDKELVAVEGDATYTATFTATKRQYTITWLNEDNSQLAQTTVEYGVIPTAPETPSKESTAEYTYTFVGWDTEPASVTGDATYTAVFDTTVNTYTITWLNSDNSPLYQEEVAYGETPAYTGETPTQESTAEYTYTFAGWDKPIEAVTGAAIYKAVYSSNKNSYTVTFYFEDGVTVLDSQTLEYGETPSTGLIPSKNDEEHYYYTFIGWYPEITPVTGDASYTPVFKKEPKQYTITFNNYNGRQLWTTTVPYGETPVYNGETPTRQRTQQYSYEFAGWSPELAAVSGDATYTALFDAIVNQYTVVFLNEDGTELERQMVDYGTKPEYQGETPTKDPDAEYRYEFAGWTPRIVAVFTDATYTATYTRHDLHEGTDDVQPPGMEAQKVLRNGTFYILRGDNVYTTDGVLVE